MANLNEVLQSIVSDVDGALGCAVVDLESGLLLAAAHQIPYFTTSYLEAVAAAAVDMMRGKNVRAIEALFSNQYGKPMSKSIQEVQMSTDNTYHFMAVIPEKPDALVVLITSRKTNLGMGWSTIRRSMPILATLCP